MAYPLWYGMFGGRKTNQPQPKPTPTNLTKFAEQPIVRRAINAVKNPVASLDFRISAKPGLGMTEEMAERAKIAFNCLENPNRDDSFASLIEQTADDALTFAGALECQRGKNARHPLYLYPVDASTIRIYPGWTGDPKEPRYEQWTGSIGEKIQFRNDELIYMRMNPRTSTPFGLTPVEVAYNLINAFITSFDFAQKLAGNALPRFGIDLGPWASTADVNVFRNYWQDDVEGQGQVPIWGGYAADDEAKGLISKIHQFGKGDDADLRMGWQQWLVRLVAISFDLPPQSLGLETTVNRATAEVMQEGGQAAAIRPMAQMISRYLTREALGRKLGWYDLRHEWVGLDPEDDLSRSQIWRNLIEADIMVPDEPRQELGLGPHRDGWGQMTRTQAKIRIGQAQGTKVATEDPVDETPAADSMQGFVKRTTETMAEALKDAGDSARAREEANTRFLVEAAKAIRAARQS